MKMVDEELKLLKEELEEKIIDTTDQIKTTAEFLNMKVIGMVADNKKVEEMVKDVKIDMETK